MVCGGGYLADSSLVDYDDNVITQESAGGGDEPKPRLWLNIDSRSKVDVWKDQVGLFQGGVVSSLNLDEREPSWLG